MKRSKLIERILLLAVLSTANLLMVDDVRSQPTVNVTTTASLFTDVNGDGDANPGDTLQYNTLISNSGQTFAQGVRFTATLDANTTLVPGTINVSPLALNDNYPVIGNTLLTVTAANGLLVNDLNIDGDPLTVTSFDPVSALGSPVSVNPDGSFTYLPPLGNSGGFDTFNYTVGDGSGMVDSGTVQLAISRLIWYVDNSAAAGGDGRSNSPFNSFAPVNGMLTDVDGPNDIIYVFFGAGNYNVDFLLENDQTLAGEGATLFVDNVLVRPAGSTPTMVAAAGSTISLADNPTVQGVNVVGGGGSGAGIEGFGISGNTALRDLSINSSTFPGILLVGSSGTAVVERVVITGISTEGVVFDNFSGDVTFNNNNISNLLGGSAVVFDNSNSMIAATFTATGNTIQNDMGSIANGIELVSSAPDSQLTFNISNNTITGSGSGFTGSGIDLQIDGTGLGTIDGNTVTGVGGIGVRVANTQVAPSGMITATISNNTISQCQSSGISVENISSYDGMANAPIVLANIIGNNVSQCNQISGTNFAGIFTGSDFSSATCVNMRGNTVSNNQVSNIRLNNDNLKSFQIAGSTTASGILAPADVTAQNTVIGGSVDLVGMVSIDRVNDGFCDFSGGM